MNDTYSLSELAAIFTDGIGGDDVRRDLMTRQLRNLATQQLISATEVRGGRRTIYLAMQEAAKARLYIAMVNFGLDSTAIRAASELWNRAADPRLELGIIDGSYPPRIVDAILRDLSIGGPDWNFVLRLRFYVETGKRVIDGGFMRADQQKPLVDEPLSNEGYDGDGVRTSDGTIQTEGTLTIPVSKLLRQTFPE